MPDLHDAGRELTLVVVDMMERPYVLGHSHRELDRLELQGILYRGATMCSLLDAGIASGMRVLDVGSGSGDLTLLVAGIVGPSGSVMGIDRDAATTMAARDRALRRGVHNVAFETSDVGAVVVEREFDAVVGRFVLMHQADPADTVSRAAEAVHTGGVCLFMESFMAGLCAGAHSHPASELYDRVVRWKCRVVASAGADIHAGLRLRQVFANAGLPEATLRMEAAVEGGPDSLIYRYMAESVRSMLPVAEENGIDGFTSESVGTLESTLRDEVVAAGGVLVCWPIVSAWCRLP